MGHHAAASYIIPFVVFLTFLVALEAVVFHFCMDGDFGVHVDMFVAAAPGLFASECRCLSGRPLSLFCSLSPALRWRVFNVVVRARVVFRGCFRFRISCRVSDAVFRVRIALIDAVRLVSCVFLFVPFISFARWGASEVARYPLVGFLNDCTCLDTVCGDLCLLA